MSALIPKADPILAFMPWVSQEEGALRRRLLAFQQRAGTRARLCENDRARHEWWLACDIAAEAVFAPAPIAHLQERLETIARMALTAQAIERWEGGNV